MSEDLPPAKSLTATFTAATDNGKGYEVDFFAFLKGPHFLTQLTQTLALHHFARHGRKATNSSKSQNTNKIRKAIIRVNKAMASMRAKPKMA
ncbi:hypothetical protein Tco_0157386 [Tanacetum coccineum]